MDFVLSKKREEEIQTFFDEIEAKLKELRELRKSEDYEGLLLELNPEDFEDMKKDYYCGPMMNWGKVSKLKVSINTSIKPNKYRFIVNGQTISNE